MNHRGITTGVIVALALLAGGASYLHFHKTMSIKADLRHDSLRWVCHEFKLSGEKRARVEALHEAYEAVCAEHCLAIAEAREDLKRLRESHASPSEIEIAAAKADTVDARCIAGTEAHIRAVAALIGGDEGRRYLALVLPRVAMFDHTAPASLDLRQAPHEHAAGK